MFSSTRGPTGTIVRLGRRLETRQALSPELVEIPAELVEPLAADPIQATRTVPALVEQSRFLEDPEMLRDRGA